jgi:hypothetical protein
MLSKNINRKEESRMKEQRDEQEARELLIAEVSIYTDDCGEIQFHCLNDCLGGGAWLNIEY